MSTKSILVAIIGGTGLDDPTWITVKEEREVDTPFGKPSDKLIFGTIKDHPVVILPRHGRKPKFMPSNVNFRANLYALRQVGVTHIFATNACGSLQPHIKRGDLVVFDDYINHTFKRQNTFFDGFNGEFPGVSHFPMARPFCEITRKIVIQACESSGFQYHPTGTICVNEGPHFSSRAESKLYQSSGASAVGMTTYPECPLARELGLSYVAIGLITDTDSWDEAGEFVTKDLVLEVFKGSVEKVKKIVSLTVDLIYKNASEMEKCIKINQETVAQSKYT